jgi:hypothetical protein
VVLDKRCANVKIVTLEVDRRSEETAEGKVEIFRNGHLNCS